jgi:hypothetical protein
MSVLIASKDYNFSKEDVIKISYASKSYTYIMSST